VKLFAIVALVLAIAFIWGAILQEVQRAHQKPAADKVLVLSKDAASKVDTTIGVAMEKIVREGEPEHVYCDVCSKDMRSKELDMTMIGMSITVENVEAKDDKTYNLRQAFLQKQLGEYEIGKKYKICWECMLKATGIKPRWAHLQIDSNVLSTDNLINTGDSALLTFESTPNYIWGLNGDTIITVVARENKDKNGKYEQRTPDRIEINGDYINYQHFDSDRNLIVIGIKEKKR
jgi:hypothetical protein